MASAFALLLAAPPGEASASFPGANGPLVYADTVFRYPKSPNIIRIRVYNPRTRGVRTLASCTERLWGLQDQVCPLESPRVSPAGDLVVAIGGHGIVLLRVDGGGSTFPSTPPGQGAFRWLTWAPDGGSLAVEGVLQWPDYPGPSGGIYRATLDGQVRERLTEPSASWFRGPTDWTADGELIGAYADRPPSQLVAVRPGQGLRVVTSRGGSQPSVSPYGRRIAFTRDGAIYTMARSGADLRRLTPRRTRRHVAYRPVWSPDGHRIAFLRDGDIWVMRRSGRGARRVLDLPGGARDGSRGVGWRGVTDLDWAVAR